MKITNCMKALGLIAFLLLCMFLQAQQIELVVLGTAQDGGYPQAGCNKSCCKTAWNNPEQRRWVSCISIINQSSNEAWLFDITPDFREQWQLLQQKTNDSIKLAGIFLTHAHMGHYSGLMHLGREAMGSKSIPVYVLPRMKNYLENNGPWSQLVRLKNIQLIPLTADSTKGLIKDLKVTPLTVPHRDEFSETAAFMITTGKRNILYLPDIDKWEKWDTNAIALLSSVDLAFVDATFWSATELPGRNMAEIPHPLVIESMQFLRTVSSKIYFIHLNHTNPLLGKKSSEGLLLKNSGFQLAEQGQIIQVK